MVIFFRDPKKMSVRQRVIAIVQDHMSITSRKSRSFIEDNADKEIVSFFGISPDNGHDLIEEMEFDFNIKAPPEVLQSTSEVEKRFLWIKRTTKRSPYRLLVPDNVTVEQLCQVASDGVWPLNFYIREE